MSWLKNIVDFISIPNAIELRRCFVLDHCRIHLESLPDTSLVLSIPHLQGSNSPVQEFIGGKQRCDLLVIIAGEQNQTVMFIEAKSGKDRDFDGSNKAVNQLKSSYLIFLDAFKNTELSLPFNDIGDCELYATCVMESMPAHSGASFTQRKLENDFYKKYRVPLRFVPADQDIWQAIQGNTT